MRIGLETLSDRLQRSERADRDELLAWTRTTIILHAVVAALYDGDDDAARAGIGEAVRMTPASWRGPS